MSKPNPRVKNTCRQCGSTWSPRNTTVSNMCPECGSQDIEVKTRPAPRKTRSAWPKLLLILGVLLLGGGGVAALFYFQNNDTTTTQKDDSPAGKEPPAVVEIPFKPRDAVQVKMRLRDTVFNDFVLLADEGVAGELAQLRTANNRASILELLKQNKIAKVPEGTKATVLGASPAGVRVKITEGGWIDREGVLPADVLELMN